MTTTPVATAATSQPEWARCRGRGEQSLHCAFVAQFPVVGSSKAGKIGLVYGRFSHHFEAHAAMLLAPLTADNKYSQPPAWGDGYARAGGGEGAARPLCAAFVGWSPCDPIGHLHHRGVATTT